MSTENYKINRVIQGDCIKILSELPNEIIDLVITDPPFNIMNKEDLKFTHRTDITQSVEFDQFPSYENYLIFTDKWIKVITEKMKQNSSLYVFFAVQYITDLMNICLNHGLKYKGVLIWHKTNPAPKIRKSGYVSSTESILFMVKGKPTFNFLGQNKMHNLIETPICMGNERLKHITKKTEKGKNITLHPTQKPLELYKHLISVSSKENDLICDPFVGTGTANVACKILNRFCIGIELNESYVQHAKNRLNRTKLKSQKTGIIHWS